MPPAGKGSGKEPRDGMTAERWAEAALDLIAREGVAALAVEPLARDLGVTKGSFYWHFANRDALLAAALERWEQRETEQVIERVRAEPDPRRRIERLFHEVVGDRRTAPLYLGLSAASADPRVGTVVRRVTERRLAFLEECFLALGLDAGEARDRALMACSLYLGFLQLRRDTRRALPKRDEMQAFVDRALRVFVP